MRLRAAPRFVNNVITGRQPGRDSSGSLAGWSVKSEPPQPADTAAPMVSWPAAGGLRGNGGCDQNREPRGPRTGRRGADTVTLSASGLTRTEGHGPAARFTRATIYGHSDQVTGTAAQAKTLLLMSIGPCHLTQHQVAALCLLGTWIWVCLLGAFLALHH